MQKAAASHWPISSLGQRKRIGDLAELQNLPALCSIVLSSLRSVVATGGKLGTGADACLSSLADEHSFHFHVSINIAVCKAMIHHPSFRQCAGDSDIQVFLLTFSCHCHSSLHPPQF